MHTEADLEQLQRCVALATEALEQGDSPFGSVLVSSAGTVLAEERNRGRSAGDPTRHPEFELARWAATHLTPDERAAATVFTSGEHCPMCSAAHAQVGLGRIVYVVSSRQFEEILTQLGHSPGPVRNLPIGEIVPGLAVEGPVPELAEPVLALYRRCYGSG